MKAKDKFTPEVMNDLMFGVLVNVSGCGAAYRQANDLLAGRPEEGTDEHASEVLHVLNLLQKIREDACFLHKEKAMALPINDALIPAVQEIGKIVAGMPKGKKGGKPRTMWLQRRSSMRKIMTMRERGKKKVIGFAEALGLPHPNTALDLCTRFSFLAGRPEDGDGEIDTTGLNMDLILSRWKRPPRKSSVYKTLFALRMATRFAILGEFDRAPRKEAAPFTLGSRGERAEVLHRITQGRKGRLKKGRKQAKEPVPPVPDTPPVVVTPRAPETHGEERPSPEPTVRTIGAARVVQSQDKLGEKFLDGVVHVLVHPQKVTLVNPKGTVMVENPGLPFLARLLQLGVPVEEVP
jgi:hypothetical protein